MSDFGQKLHRFIAEEADLEPSSFDADTALFSEGLIDSFTMTTVIAFIEDETGIAVDQSDVTLENFDTIGRMVAFVGSARSS